MFVFGWGWGGGVCRRINNYMLNFVFWTPKLFKSWYLLCSLAFSFLPDWPLCRVQGGQNLHIFCPHHHRLIAAQSIAQIATYSPPNTSLTAPSTSNLLKISANGDLMSRLRARVKMTFTNMVQLLIWGLLYANEIFRKRICFDNWSQYPPLSLSNTFDGSLYTSTTFHPDFLSIFK